MPAEDAGREPIVSRLKHLEHLVDIISRSQRGYRELIDSFDDFIFMMSLDGRFQAANRPFVKLIGKPFPEVIGRRFDEFFDEPRRAQALEAEAEFLRKQYWSGTVRLRAKGSTAIRYFDCVLNAVMKDSAVIGLSGIARDITERKSLEDQLRQAQKMEAVGRLAGGVAHDFNNLLTVIKGFAEVVLAGVGENARLVRAAEEINKAADRAASLTQQLLAFSRRQVMDARPVNLNDVVRNLHKMLRRLIGEDIELVHNLTADLEMVKADPVQVEQVIMNLAVNARDAMPDGGRITIETQNVMLGNARIIPEVEVPAGKYVLLAVGDTGHGMDAETQSHIFEPFFTTKEPGKGTGLGLSTVYGIIKQSGGYIFAESQLGHGATFRIYLPLAARIAPATEPRAAAAQPTTGSETILLVEDETNVRALLSEILRKKGYRVIEAADGYEALRAAQIPNTSIHLLMADMVMPGISGPEVARQLAPLYPSMKILYMSGYIDDMVRTQQAVVPGSFFLQKPFSEAVLTRKVRDVLESA